MKTSKKNLACFDKLSASEMNEVLGGGYWLKLVMHGKTIYIYIETKDSAQTLANPTPISFTESDLASAKSDINPNFASLVKEQI